MNLALLYGSQGSMGSLPGSEDEKVVATQMKKDNIERKQIYFWGHTDGYAYLKKIGAV